MSELQRIKVTRVPFNYEWPHTRQMSVIRELGAAMVGFGKNEVHPDIAEAAIKAGYAQPFNPRSPKRAASGKKPDAADEGQSDSLGDGDLSQDDRPGDQPSDDAAG